MKTKETHLKNTKKATDLLGKSEDWMSEGSKELACEIKCEDYCLVQYLTLITL